MLREFRRVLDGMKLIKISQNHTMKFGRRNLSYSISLKSHSFQFSWMKKINYLILGGSLTIGATFISKTHCSQNNNEELIETSSGLKYRDVKLGKGACPVEGDRILVHYLVWSDGFDGMQLVESTLDLGEPKQMVLSKNFVHPGFLEALLTTPIGTVREIIIPPQLMNGYEQGAVPDRPIYCRVHLVRISFFRQFDAVIDALDLFLSLVRSQEREKS